VQEAAISDEPNRTAEPEAIIRARNLTRSFGHLTALSGVNLAVRRGEFLALFGPNGAGKSTLLRILAGLLAPTAGGVEIAGRDLTANPELRRRLGVISHQTLLYGQLTALENVVFYARLYDVPNPAARAEEVIAAVGLSSRRHDLVRTFSRGMQQRLAIARATVHDPDLLLLDEPYTGLDQQAAHRLTEALERAGRRDRTVVMTTHDISRGLAMADRAALLINGKLVEEKSAPLDPAEFERRYLELTGGRE
jgi:heme exporter protein A